MAVITIKGDFDEKSIQNKIEDLIDDTTMLEIHNLFAKLINPWVPFLEGPLSQNLEVTSEYVRYLQIYANYQYWGLEFNHTKDFHPLASATWDKVALQTELEKFEEGVKAILERRAKELYG